MGNISVTITGELSYKTGCNFSLIPISEIVYTVYQDERCTISLANGEKHTVCCQLKELLYLLPSHFFPIDRNTMINLTVIKSINKNTIVLHPDIIMKISIRKQRLLIKKLLANDRNYQNGVIQMNAYPRKSNA